MLPQLYLWEKISKPVACNPRCLSIAGVVRNVEILIQARSLAIGRLIALAVEIFRKARADDFLSRQIQVDSQTPFAAWQRSNSIAHNLFNSWE